MKLCLKTILAYVMNRLQKGTYGRGFARRLILSIRGQRTGDCCQGMDDQIPPAPVDVIIFIPEIQSFFIGPLPV